MDTTSATIAELQLANKTLQAEVAQLRRQLAALEEQPASPPPSVAPSELPGDITAPEFWQSGELLQTVLDTLPDPIFVKDRQHRWIACNQAFCALIGYPYEQIIGYSDPDRWPAEQARVFWEKDDEVFASGSPVFNEEDSTSTDGVTRTIWTRKFPLFNAEQRVIGLCGIITDISELKQRQEALARREEELETQAKREQLAVQEAIIAAQETAIRELSTPLIPISDTAVVMPLVGTIGPERAQQIMETLLEGVAAHQSEIVILDITGVQVVDEQVANALMRASQAVRLLGTRVVLTGIQPQIAQTLVQQEVDLSGITTHGTLQAGIATVLQQ
jgi:rsbT co-antagonist protein RsbR